MDQEEIRLRQVRTVTSQRGKLNSIDLRSLAMTLVMVAFSSVVSYLLTYIPMLDLSKEPEYIAMLIPAITMILKLLQKVLSERVYIVK